MTATGTESLWNFFEAAPKQKISWNFGDAISEGGTGLKGVTQFSAPSGVVAVRQDGQGTGFPFAARVSTLGVVYVDFTTGQTLTLGTIPIVVFERFSGLARFGIDAWLAGELSGPPLPGQPGLGGRAALLPGFLEEPSAR